MCCNSNLFIHTSDASASHLMKSSVSSLLRAAVAQRIERHTDYVAGNGFESRQWHAHQVAPQFVARGYFLKSLCLTARSGVINPDFSLELVVPIATAISPGVFDGNVSEESGQNEGNNQNLCPKDFAGLINNFLCKP